LGPRDACLLPSCCCVFTLLLGFCCLLLRRAFLPPVKTLLEPLALHSPACKTTDHLPLLITLQHMFCHHAIDILPAALIAPRTSMHFTLAALLLPARASCHSAAPATLLLLLPGPPNTAYLFSSARNLHCHMQVPDATLPVWTCLPALPATYTCLLPAHLPACRLGLPAGGLCWVRVTGCLLALLCTAAVHSCCLPWTTPAIGTLFTAGYRHAACRVSGPLPCCCALLLPLIPYPWDAVAWEHSRCFFLQATAAVLGGSLPATAPVFCLGGPRRHSAHPALPCACRASPPAGPATCLGFCYGTSRTACLWVCSFLPANTFTCRNTPGFSLFLWKPPVQYWVLPALPFSLDLYLGYLPA